MISVFLQKILQRIPLSVRMLLDVLSYWRELCRYNASMNTNADDAKMRYTLLRENHVIEKGMSLRNTRIGFGQEKVNAYIERLRLYHRLYGDKDNQFILYPLSTIKAYIEWQRRDGVELPEIKAAFARLCHETGVSEDSLSIPSGIQIMQSSVLQSLAAGNFEDLLFSRHSIRYFKDVIPSQSLLSKALTLAARTPSACNRQAWHTHIYVGDDSHKLLEMQGGCGGFYNEVHCSIVVSADMKGFLHYEPFQCYIDGGLYAMNLINALHYVGFGTIPLSCGFYRNQLKPIYKTFEIPRNEVMIVIIGVGVLTDEVKVAVSTRRPTETTNLFHY